MTSTPYISEPNKHIEEYFDYYFDGKKNFEYAVLLNGAWGSGKTWFVKQYIEKLKNKDKKVAYISLNGLSKTSDIDDEIFRNIHPKLASKGAKILGKVAKGALKAAFRFDWDGDSKPDGQMSVSIPNIELPDYLKITSKFVLVFDDLERCELKKEEVLGYINYFVEQEGIRTLIVSNEEEITKNTDYSKKKEKLIGATFYYIEDQELAIRSILHEVENRDLNILLTSNFELIKQTFNQVGYKNLRSFKQTIFAFERFYKKDYFAPKVDFDNEIFEKVLKAFLILSLENKKGYFDKNILEFKKDEKLEEEKKIDTKNMILKTLGGIKSVDSEKFMNKHNCSLKDFIFSPKIWNEILNQNILDEKKICDELYEVYFRFKQDKPTWLKLMDFWDLEATEFDSLAKQAKKEIEDFLYTHHTDILHTISMLIYFKEQNLIHFNVENLLPLAIRQFKQVFNVNDKMRKIEDSSFREYSGQYGFYAKDIPLFKNFMDDIIKSYEEKYIEKNSERIIELLDLMEKNAWLFAQRISLNNSEENLYYNFPILKEIEANIFALNLCNISQHNSNAVLSGLNKRYSIRSSFNMYIEEKDWLEEVENNIKADILPSSDKILRAKINLHILPRLVEIKDNAIS